MFAHVTKMRLLASPCLSVCCNHRDAEWTFMNFWRFGVLLIFVDSFSIFVTVLQKLSHFVFSHAHFFACLEPDPVSTVTNRVTLLSKRFAIRQAVQRSPLLQIAVNRDPHVLIQYICINIRLEFDIFKGHSLTFPSTCRRITSKSRLGHPPRSD